MKQKTEIRKEQIKEAVLRIVYNDGLKKCTTKRVAEEIGITEAAIFRHYPSKKEIFLDIIQDVETQLLGALKEILDESIPSDQKLQKLICRSISFNIENKGINILMLSEAAVNNDIDMKSKLNGIYLEQRKIIEKIILDGIKEEIFKKETNPKTFSFIYMGIPVAINIDFILNPAKIEISTICDQLLNLICIKK
ncbi:MAG: TetR/AcrR family transcriptional regulator [Bacteroidales bacterium]